MLERFGGTLRQVCQCEGLSYYGLVLINYIEFLLFPCLVMLVIETSCYLELSIVKYFVYLTVLARCYFGCYIGRIVFIELGFVT